MHKVWLLIGFILFLVGCAQVPPETNGGTFIAAETGYELHWTSEAFPIEVLIDERFTPEVQLMILVGCEIWNHEFMDTFDTEAQVFNCQITHLGRMYVTEADLAYVPSGSVVITATPLPPLFIGITLPEFSAEGVIKSALIVFNLYGDSTDLIYATVHELGHAVGLAHDPQVESIMYEAATDVHGELQGVDLYHVFRQMHSPFTFSHRQP